MKKLVCAFRYFANAAKFGINGGKRFPNDHSLCGVHRQTAYIEQILLSDALLLWPLLTFDITYSPEPLMQQAWDLALFGFRIVMTAVQDT